VGDLQSVSDLGHLAKTKNVNDLKIVLKLFLRERKENFSFWASVQCFVHLFHVLYICSMFCTSVPCFVHLFYVCTSITCFIRLSPLHSVYNIQSILVSFALKI
jgi:hypothetical protein